MKVTACSLTDKHIEELRIFAEDQIRPDIIDVINTATRAPLGSMSRATARDTLAEAWNELHEAS